MSRFLVIRKNSIHVPSIARARLLPTPFLRRPMIYMEGHSGEAWHVSWPRYPFRMVEWQEAEQEFRKLQTAMEACSKALEVVPRLEEKSLI